MRHIEGDIMFDSTKADDEEIIISLVNEQNKTYIYKHIDAGSTWKEALNDFLDMLIGIGYIIDKVKVEKYIENV